MPLEIGIDVDVPYRRKSSVVNEKICRFFWNDKHDTEVRQNLQTIECRTGLVRAVQMLDTDVDSALKCFVQTLLSQAECMQRVVKTSSSRKEPHSKRFDLECRGAKRNARKALLKFRRSSHRDDRHRYIELRTEYKKIIRAKQSEYCRTTCETLLSNVNNSATFWPLVRRATNRRPINPSIDLGDWQMYFESLFSSTTGHIVADEERVLIEHDDLDARITEDEVKHAIAKLRHRRAPGIDDIPGDYLKLASGQVMPFLVALFNVIYEKQYFPSGWNQSIIIPLHKSGDKLNLKHYRGISLLCSISKLFLSILTNRLREWAE